MFMHKSKKGFTIVELVIVIAVIAILAAVLIPTFSNLVKKANIASDTTLAKNLNTALASYGATNGVEEFADVIAAAKEAGYIISNLNPTTEGCYFVWEKDTNQILLVDSTDGYKVIYANNEDYADAGATWYFAVRTQAEATEIKAAAGMADVNAKLAISKTSTLNTEINNVTNGDTIYIDGGIEVDEKNVIKVDNASAKVVLDLGSSAVVGGSNNTEAEAFPFEVTAGEMSIKGGLIGATAAFIDADGRTGYSAVNAAGGVLNITDTVFDTDNTQAYFVCYDGGDGTLKNVTVDAPNANNVIGAWGGSDVRVEDCNVLADWAAIVASYQGGISSVTIDGGTYQTVQGNVIDCLGGDIIVEDGNFKAACGGELSNLAKTFRFRNLGGTITLKGGTFNGVAFENLTKTQLEGWAQSDTGREVKVEKVGDTWVLSEN